LSQEQADGALVRVDMSLTLVAKARANRRLEMPLLSSVVSLQYVDEDAGCVFNTQPAKKQREKGKLFVLRIISFF